MRSWVISKCCNVMAKSLLSNDRECITNKYIFQIVSQDEKSTTYINNMQKVLKELVILLHIHILRGYGRTNSTLFVFLRRQGWGFAINLLLLKKKGIHVKRKKEVGTHSII